MRILFLFVLLAVPAFLAYADPTVQDIKPPVSDETWEQTTGVGGQGALSAPGGLGTFIETVFVLALFIGALYALYRFLQRKRDLGGAGGDAVRVLAHQTLGGSKAIEVVEVGRRVFVLGVADSAINLIAEINDEEALESLRLDYVRSENNMSESFMDRLIRVLGRSKQHGQEVLSREKLDYLRAQKERLSAFKKKQ